MGNYTQMIAQLMPFLQQYLSSSGSTPGTGAAGTALTPGMQAAASSGPGAAVTPQDASTATIAGVQPGAPSPASFTGGGANSAQLAAALGPLASALSQPAPQARPQMAPGFRGSGAGPQMPKPVASPQVSPTSVGAYLASPAGQQIMSQLRGLMSSQPSLANA
jgi:hypothetical protein